MTKFNPRDPQHVHSPPSEQDDGDSTIVHNSNKTSSAPSGGYSHNSLDFDFSEDFGSEEEDEDGGDATMLSNAPPEFDAGGGAPLEAQCVAGRYELISLIGEGATGKVYRARDLELDDIIALKLLLPGQLNNPEILARFKREVRLSRKITHRNVARVFDLGEENGRYYLTMELINGKSLDRILEHRGTLPLLEAYDLAIQICEGLYAAHSVEVIHRDLKPENILVEYSGRAVITDFGIARHASGSRDFQTVVGSVIGTPAYMAPEQIATNTQIDARADIYAFGAILFEMVTGQQAWQGDNIFAIIAARLTNPPPDPRRYNPSLPTPLAELILQCMEREPNQRPHHIANVLQTLQSLRNLPQGPPIDNQATIASLDILSVPPPRASSHTPFPSSNIQQASRQSPSLIPVGTPVSPEQKHTPPPHLPVATSRNFSSNATTSATTPTSPRATSPSYTHAEQSLPRRSSPSYPYAQQIPHSLFDSPLDVVAGTPSRHEVALQQDSLRAKTLSGTTEHKHDSKPPSAIPVIAPNPEPRPSSDTSEKSALISSSDTSEKSALTSSSDTSEKPVGSTSPSTAPSDDLALPEIPTLLLLPVSGAPPHLAAFSEELARALTEQLSLFPKISVSPPEVTSQTRGKNITLKQFHRDFGADLLLTLQIKHQQNNDIEISIRIQATVGGKILHTSRLQSSAQSAFSTAQQILRDLHEPLQLLNPQKPAVSETPKPAASQAQKPAASELKKNTALIPEATFASELAAPKQSTFPLKDDKGLPPKNDKGTLSLEDDLGELFPPSPSRATVPPLTDPKAIATDAFFGDDLFPPKSPTKEEFLFSADSIGDDFLLPTSSIDEDFLSPLPPPHKSVPSAAAPVSAAASARSASSVPLTLPPQPVAPMRISSSKEALQQLLRAKASLNKQWQGDLSEPLALFESLQKDFPHDPAPLAGIAIIKARQAFPTSGPNDPPLQDARKTALSALSLDPEHANSLYALALIDFYRHAWEDALRHLAKLLEQGHPHPKAHALLGSIMLEIGSLGGAIDNLQHALALDPTYLTARFESARGYALLEQWSDVDRLLELPAPNEQDERTRNLYQARLNLWRPDPQRLEISGPIAADNQTQQSLRILNHVRATKQFPKTLQNRFYQTRIDATKSLRLHLLMRQELIEILAFVQDWDAAFSVLQEAFDLQLYDLNWLSRCPLFQPVQQDPRYLRFLEQLKLRVLPLHKRLQETY